MAEISRERPARVLRDRPAPARLLVVDDSSEFRDVVRRALEGEFQSRLPLEIEEAGSVEEALRLIQAETFDLIVLDLGFPRGLQGAMLPKRLRESGGDVPVLVITGNIVGLDSAELFRFGAADVLGKPVPMYVLRHAVAEILRVAEAARRPYWREAAARILHVEDTDEWAALVRLWVRQSDYASFRVATGQELLRFLRVCKELPDCILLDLTLPDTDGLALCDRLKSQSEFQGIPLVVFTARGDDRLAALRHRAVHAVLKPDGSDRPVREELFAAIDTVVDQSERTRGVVKRFGLRLDPKGCRVFSGPRRAATIAPAKFAMLRLLLERSPQAVSEEELRRCLPRVGYKRGHPEDPEPNTVAVYVSKLRRQVDLAPALQIINQPGKGYALLANPAAFPL